MSNLPSNLDIRVSNLAANYASLGRQILAEAVRIPSDHVHVDPSCGLSNHEGPRLEYLRRTIVEVGAVRRPEDVGFDGFGNLVWTVQDETDGVPPSEKRVIYLDGHSDTVKALREQWLDKIGGGIDAYDGLREGKVDRSFLRGELGWLPPDEEWNHLLFGRGSADQLSGVVSQIVASKILLELVSEGALRGAIVRSYATVSEEDNDGGGPMYLMRQVLPAAPPELVPDVVILTEGTGDARKGALGIYRGQRGRMQIEVNVRGRSCHGSMPWEGLNPLEYGAAILVEARQKYDARDGFLDHEFLGHGTRTASWARLDTPSDCAVPERFVFRFDRRLTVGETPEGALSDVEALDAVKKARADGLSVTISVPHYDELTWKGYRPGNPQIYVGWETPEAHPAVQAAAVAYRAVVSPHVSEGGTGGSLRRQPRIDRWIFSTDGVGYSVPVHGSGISVSPKKNWVVGPEFMHPPMLGVGPGIEQNTHKIGECVDIRELRHAIAMLARFPRAFVDSAEAA